MKSAANARLRGAWQDRVMREDRAGCCCGRETRTSLQKKIITRLVVDGTMIHNIKCKDLIPPKVPENLAFDGCPSNGLNISERR